MRKLPKEYKLVSWVMNLPEKHWTKIGIYSVTNMESKTDFIREAIYKHGIKKGIFTEEEMSQVIGETKAGRRR